MSSPTPRKYWSERQGRGPNAEPLGFPRLRKLAISVLDDFWRRDYFVEAFGYYCVDAGDVHGTLGSAPEAWFLRALNRDEVWPYQSHADGYDADTLFDMTEALYDLIAKPREGWYHDFAGCGMHWQTFDKTAGQEELRAELQPLFERYDPPLELSATGEIVALVPPDLRGLLDAPVPVSGDPDLVTSLSSARSLGGGRREPGAVGACKDCEHPDIREATSRTVHG